MASNYPIVSDEIAGTEMERLYASSDFGDAELRELIKRAKLYPKKNETSNQYRSRLKKAINKAIEKINFLEEKLVNSPSRSHPPKLSREISDSKKQYNLLREIDIVLVNSHNFLESAPIFSDREDKEAFSVTEQDIGRKEAITEGKLDTYLNISNDNSTPLSELLSRIIDFLATLPNIHDKDAQYALISRAGLGFRLQNRLQSGLSPFLFAENLVDGLIKYGTLGDGRGALEVLLEASKQFVGQDRGEFCDELIQQLSEIRRT